MCVLFCRNSCYYCPSGQQATLTPVQLQYDVTEGSPVVNVCVRVTAASNTNQLFTVTFDTSAEYKLGATATLENGKFTNDLN